MKIRSMTLFIILFASVFLFPQQIEREISVKVFDIVYINTGESEFHLRKCEKLAKSRYSFILKLALKRGYTPCPLCIPFKEVKQPKVLPEKKDILTSEDLIDVSRVERLLSSKISRRVSNVSVELKSEQGLINVYVDYGGWYDNKQAGVIITTVEFFGKYIPRLEGYEAGDISEYGNIIFQRYGKPELRLVAAVCFLIMIQETPEKQEQKLRQYIEAIK